MRYLVVSPKINGQKHINMSWNFWVSSKITFAKGWWIYISQRVDNGHNNERMHGIKPNRQFSGDMSVLRGGIFMVYLPFND